MPRWHLHVSSLFLFFKIIRPLLKCDVFNYIFEDWFTVCKGKKERDLKKWKWQIALVYSPWIIGFADSLAGIGFGFHHYNRLWFCDTLSDHYSPHKWRPNSVAALLGVVNVLIIGVMVSLIRVSFYHYFWLNSLTSFSYICFNASWC